jgi:hypothetical protein
MYLDQLEAHRRSIIGLCYVLVCAPHFLCESPDSRGFTSGPSSSATGLKNVNFFDPKRYKGTSQVSVSLW